MKRINLRSNSTASWPELRRLHDPGTWQEGRLWGLMSVGWEPKRQRNEHVSWAPSNDNGVSENNHDDQSNCKVLCTGHFSKSTLYTSLEFNGISCERELNPAYVSQLRRYSHIHISNPICIISVKTPFLIRCSKHSILYHACFIHCKA